MGNHCHTMEKVRKLWKNVSIITYDSSAACVQGFPVTVKNITSSTCANKFLTHSVSGSAHLLLYERWLKMTNCRLLEQLAHTFIRFRNMKKVQTNEKSQCYKYFLFNIFSPIKFVSMKCICDCRFLVYEHFSRDWSMNYKFKKTHRI